MDLGRCVTCVACVFWGAGGAWELTDLWSHSGGTAEKRVFLAKKRTLKEGGKQDLYLFQLIL